GRAPGRADASGGDRLPAACAAPRSASASARPGAGSGRARTPVRSLRPPPARAPAPPRARQSTAMRIACLTPSNEARMRQHAEAPQAPAAAGRAVSPVLTLADDARVGNRGGARARPGGAVHDEGRLDDPRAPGPRRRGEPEP